MDSDRLTKPAETHTAVIAVTDNGVRLALQIQAAIPGSLCHVPARHRFAVSMGAEPYDRLGSVFRELWGKRRAFICIMATGIVVRLLAPLLRNKTTDPAVVALDERGQFVISLVSGHLGGANRLAHEVAKITGGRAVVTTASDVSGKPAIDLLAKEAGLDVENPKSLARTARAILEDEPLWIFDPWRLISPRLEDLPGLAELGPEEIEKGDESLRSSVGIWVSEFMPPEGCKPLVLRPRNLVLGIGCNRGTAAGEILELIHTSFASENLSPSSIRNLASVDLKADEPGMIEAAKALDRPILFFSRKEIENINVPNPSSMVEKHLGVSSVCEATALLSARATELVMPKQKSLNATLAAARVGSSS